jgi:hypothetical protein
LNSASQLEKKCVWLSTLYWRYSFLKWYTLNLNIKSAIVFINQNILCWKLNDMFLLITNWHWLRGCLGVRLDHTFPNFWFFLLKKLQINICLSVFWSFWCADVKNKKIWKNIILMHFQEKRTLKNNFYHTPKPTCVW